MLIVFRQGAYIWMTVIVAAVASIVLTSPAAQAAAATAASTADPNRQIVVSPAFLHQSVAPGTTRTVAVKVQNQTASTYDFAVSRVDLVAARDDACGEPVQLAPGTSRRGAGSWVVGAPTSFSINGSHERSIAVTMRVPQDVAPGSYAASVLVQAQGRGAGNISLRAEIGIPVLIDVGGVERSGVSAALHVHGSSIRWRARPIMADVRIANTGHFAQNIGAEVVLDGWLSSTKQRVRSTLLLPGATCSRTVRLPIRQAPDRYASVLRVAYATTGTSDEKPVMTMAGGRSLLVLPWWFLGLIIIAVAAIIWRIRAGRGLG